MSNRTLIALALALCSLAVSALPASATVMTFNIKKTNDSNPTLWTNDTNVGGFGAYIPYAPYVNYGDHVAGATQDIADAQHTTYNYLEGNGFTPNIGVVESDTNHPATMYFDNHWDYLTLFQHNEDTGGISTINFTFTPDPDYAVRVNSLLLRNYQLDNVQAWTLYQDTIGGAVLASSDTTGQGKAGGPADEFHMNTDFEALTALTNADFYKGTLILSVHTIRQDGPTGGENFGFKDINFDQVLAPEPASLGLLGAGLLMVISRRRK